LAKGRMVGAFGKMVSALIGVARGMKGAHQRDTKGLDA